MGQGTTTVGRSLPGNMLWPPFGCLAPRSPAELAVAAVSPIAATTAATIRTKRGGCDAHGGQPPRLTNEIALFRSPTSEGTAFVLQPTRRVAVCAPAMMDTAVTPKSEASVKAPLVV